MGKQSRIKAARRYHREMQAAELYQDPDCPVDFATLTERQTRGVLRDLGVLGPFVPHYGPEPKEAPSEV